MDTDEIPVTPVGVSFANLCGRTGGGNIGTDCLFVITGLIAGLPTNVPKWDDLRGNHIVALYKCTGRSGNNLTIAFVANLLNDAFALAIDLHETTSTCIVPAVHKFYVPKAISTLLEMGPSLTGHSALANAKFIDQFNINPSFKYFVWEQGVSAAEIALVKRAKNKSAAVRTLDEVDVTGVNYQQQMSFVRIQEKANKEASERFLQTAEGKRKNNAIQSSGIEGTLVKIIKKVL
jgi:hypothetical protein